jgi:8-oxo-dGTP pyrophosphatase MutT (NUDIX family)
MKKKIMTLCVPVQDGKVLLGMKKRGFGMGRWNGFGGKIEPGETIEEAAMRETFEEAEIAVEAMEPVGILEFEFEGNPQILEVHIFRVTQFSGVPTETEEMKPEWYRDDAIPFKKMWPDDIHWFPLFLAGKKFTGKFLFGPKDAIVRYEINGLR